MNIFLITLQSCTSTEPLAEMVIDPETNKQIPRFFLETAGVRTLLEATCRVKITIIFLHQIN